MTDQATPAQPNQDSILDSVKKLLSIDPSYLAFDIDVTLHINSVFATLQQLGIGPASAFYITDNSTKWTDFIGVNPNIAFVKSYMFLRVKLLFDPPTTSFALQSFEKQIEEFEWRFTVAADEFARIDQVDSPDDILPPAGLDFER